MHDGFKKNKTINEVLDKPTVLTIYEMIKSQILSYVNGVIRAGKESVVFWAVSPDNDDIALKTYLISTSSFKKRASYISGDPRFFRIKSGTRNLVYLWAKKEYQNLTVNGKYTTPDFIIMFIPNENVYLIVKELIDKETNKIEDGVIMAGPDNLNFIILMWAYINGILKVQSQIEQIRKETI